MKVNVTDQLAVLALTILTGLCAGILYDLFRVIRRKLKSCLFVTVITDLVYCLVYAATLFLLGYMGGGGIFRIYMPFVSILFLLVYLCLFSRSVMCLLLLFADFLEKIIRFLLSPIIFVIGFAKKAAFFLKKIFYYKKKCYTIKVSRNLCLTEATKTLVKTEGHTYETEKGKYNY